MFGPIRLVEGANVYDTLSNPNTSAKEPVILKSITKLPELVWAIVNLLVIELYVNVKLLTPAALTALEIALTS